ncbi:hypothetical protein LTS18_001803, partial [Coniosporium uncinatum]
MPENLTQTALQSKTVGLFLDMYLPKDSISTQVPQNIGHNRLTRIIQDIHDRDEALRFSLLAISATRVGKDLGDEVVANQGLRMYSKALRQVNLALQDPRRVLKDEVLAACTMLASYEILQKMDPAPGFSQGINWRNHSQGVARLLELRGPDRHISGHSHQLFTDIRYGAIVGAITARKATFLAKPEWKSIPWSISPKTFKDRTLDVLADVAGMLENFDHLQATAKTSPSAPS